MYQSISFLIGFILAIMISVNGVLSGFCGVFAATVIIHMVGSVFAFFILKIKQEKICLPKKIPLWLYSGGAFGVFTTVTNNFAFGKISMSAIVGLGLLGQIITSLIFDYWEARKRKENHFLTISLGIYLVFAAAGIGVMLWGAGSMQVIPVVLSVISGATVVISRMMNAGLAEHTGPLQGSLINHLVGLPITVILAMFLAEGQLTSRLAAAAVHPWIFLGGTLGVLVVVLLNITVPKIAAFQLTLYGFLGQMFMGAFIDVMILNQKADASFWGGIVLSIGILIGYTWDERKSKKQKR